MRILSGYRGNIRFWLKGYLFLGIGVMILVMLIYSNYMIGRMRANSELTTRQFSRYFAEHIFEIAEDGRLASLREVISETDLPIIVTVLDGLPIIWHNVPVDDRTPEELENLINVDINNPQSEKMRRLIELYREFDRINPPIPIKVAGVEDYRDYIHYGRSPLEKDLRRMPFIQLAIFLVFMAVAIQGVRYLKLSEERSVWVGMAKETAHQLGTPLSAMLGWIQLIKEQAQDKDVSGMSTSIAEMEIDLERLNKISDRFSKIGSQPELTEVDLGDILKRTAEYFTKRMSQENTQLTVDLDGIPRVRGNAELLEWVFENLIKNGLDAMGESGGFIRITYVARQRSVDVLVADSGKGIPQWMRDRVFRPGFTTKKRGWGLGLPLSRRIVEEYHHGVIKVVESAAGKGTTFMVRLTVS